MLNAFYNPKDAILDAKKLGNWVSTLSVLLISAVLIAVCPIIFFKHFTWEISLVVMCVAVGAAVVSGLFTKLCLEIMGAKNPSYFDSLTSIVYGVAPFSVAMLAAVLLLMIPKAGLYLAVLAAAMGTVLLVSTQIKAIKELTRADMITSVVCFMIVKSAMGTASYIMYTTAILTWLANLFVVSIMPAAVNATTTAINATA